ncbi:MAG: ABC transporter permease [Kyrpidia sp.]|nr:ABC transporter permease [Kyrpidia sp.]
MVMDAAQTSGPWWLPILSVTAAMIFCAFLIALNGLNPLVVYADMVQGAFGSGYGLGETVVKAIPLLLCGIGVALAYRIAFWNIGAEGQFLAGAMGATAVTMYLPHLPGPVDIPAMFVAGALAGAVWGLLPGVLRVYFQVNELISSLMLNYVAALLLDYFVFGPWKDPMGYNFPGTPMFQPWQQLMTFGGSRVHLGLGFALAAVALYGFVLNYTRWGYELRVLGASPAVARYAGISIGRKILTVMLLSGALAGVAGMSEVSGVAHRLMYGVSPGYGYTAIIVAWIAKLHPVGLILASVLFGGVIVGGYSVQTIGLPASMSLMLQGAILLFLIGGETLSRVRIVRNGPNGEENAAVHPAPEKRGGEAWM